MTGQESLSRTVLSAFWEIDNPGFETFLSRVKASAPRKIFRFYRFSFFVFLFSPWITGTDWRLLPFLGWEKKRKVLDRLKQAPYPLRLLFFFLRSSSLSAYAHSAASPATPPAVAKAMASRRSDEETDFIVVGSGAGGGAVACALARAGKRVLVLEEGSDPDGVGWNSSLLSLQSNLFRNWGLQSATASDSVRIPLLQARGVGGTAHISGRILHRLPRAWIEKFSEYDFANEQDQILKEIGIATLDASSVWARTLDSLRWKYASMQRAENSPTFFLEEAQRLGAKLVSQQRVVSLRKKGGCVTGIVTDSGEVFQAKEGVIVSAGALQTPWILWQSGIRPKALGNAFNAHLSVSVLGKGAGIDPRLEVFQFDSQNIKLASQSGPWELMLSRNPATGAELRGLYESRADLGSWMASIVPEASGRVSFNRFGPHANLKVTHREVERMRFAMVEISRLMLRAGYRHITPGLTKPLKPLESEGDLQRIESLSLDPRLYFMGAGHLFGGCPWGEDPEQSVVDTDLKVHGIDGLWLCDASVFPAPTGVNPLLGILAVARRLGTRLGST